jgi:cyclic di-GMP phosphodiesterase
VYALTRNAAAAVAEPFGDLTSIAALLPSRPAARILIVDDDESVRRVLVRMLTAEGYEAEPANDGSSALRAIAANTPDLILLDVKLPDIDGIEVCRRLKSAPETRLVPIVLVTGLTDRTYRLQGIQAGADDFVGKPFDSAELKARVKSLVRLKHYIDELDDVDAIVRSLALTIEARDAYTEGHCERLSKYAVTLGERLGLGADQLSALDRGAYIHDIGKIGVPDALLLKPGPLTSDEFEQMKHHTITGDHICGELRSLNMVREIVRHHHERLDGSGYPDGLRGDQVPLLAQIVSIVDSYDAVTTDRPYRRARHEAAAYAELLREVAHGRYRRDLVEAFISLSRNSGLPAVPTTAL